MVVQERTEELSRTGEYIPANASHWRIEPFIPVPPSDLTEYLQALLPAGPVRESFAAVCDQLLRWVHQQSFSQHQQLDAAYAALDPDRDTSLLMDRQVDEQTVDAADVARLMRTALDAADYLELSREELEAACEVSSLWGVRLKVDFEIFQHLGVFARGDIVGVREIRRPQGFYRRETLEVEIYRRLIVLFQIKPNQIIEGEGQADRLYLRMFKNIPKADVDMLLPGSKIRFGWFDHTKILVPSLGGIGMTLWKLVRLVLFLAVVSTGKLLLALGLVFATFGYIARSVSSYFNTRKKYELNMARSLFFQKLDSNAGVIFRVLEEARQQQYREAVLAYYALLTATEVPMGRRRLKRRCERMLRDLLEIEIMFEVDDALQVLQRLKMIQEHADDCWSCEPAPLSL